MSLHRIRINSIKCNSQKDAKGEAEIWLLAQSDGGIPVRYPEGITLATDIQEGGTWTIDDLLLDYDGCCNLAIYEQDLDLGIGLTDFQGCVSFYPNENESGSKVATNGTDSGESDYSNYTVYFTREY